MKKIVLSLFALCAFGSVFAANPSFQFINTKGLSNVTDTTLYQYIEVASRSPGINGYPSPRFAISSNGTNFSQLSPNQTNAFVDTTASAQMFTPAIMWWPAINNYLVSYDIFATAGTGAAFTNKMGMLRSPDLVNWTNVGPISLATAPAGDIWGARWFFQDGWPYLTFAGGYPAARYCYITWPLDTTLATWQTPIVIATNTFGAAGVYDPSLVKNNGIYYLFCADVGSDIVVFTNATSCSNLFSYYNTNLFNGSGTKLGQFEGPNVVTNLNGGGYIMYLIADSANTSKKFYSTSADLISWTTPQELNENGDNMDNGSVWLLGKMEANAAENLQVSKNALPQDSRVYDIATTNGASGFGPTNYSPSCVVEVKHYYITAISSDGKMAEWDAKSLWEGDNANNQVLADGALQIVSYHAPDATWAVSLLDLLTVSSVNAYALKVTGPATVGVHWHVREVTDHVAPFQGWINANISANGTQLADPLLNPLLNALTVTNGVTLKGTITTYNNVATTDNGVPSIVGALDSFQNTGAIGSTPLYTPVNTNGHYRVSGTVSVTTAGTGTNALNLNWKGPGQAGGATQTLLVQNNTSVAGLFITNSVPLTALGQYSIVPFDFRSTNSAINISTVNNIGGGAKYDVNVVLEALNSK